MSLDRTSALGIIQPSMRKISNKNAAEIAVLLETVVAKYGDAVQGGKAVFTKRMGVDSPALSQAVLRLQMLMTQVTGKPVSEPVLASLCKAVHGGDVSMDAVTADNLVRLETFYRLRRNG